MFNYLIVCSLVLQTLFSPMAQASALAESGRQRLTLTKEPPAPTVSPDQNKSIERLLNTALMSLTQGHLTEALQDTQRLIAQAPNFKLAYLIQGDILMALAQRDAITQSTSSPRIQSEIKNYREEARQRIARYLEKPKSALLPDAIWMLDKHIPYLLVVDTKKSRLHLFQNDNGHLNHITDYYVTLGKNGVDKKIQGDKRTPLGIYYISTSLKRKLPDMYGELAFPLSYPNEWDKHQQKTGSGIWLHGTPSNTYSRAPQDSDGCVVLANPELHALQRLLEPGNAMMIIAHDLTWVTQQINQSQKSSLLQAIEAWRRDWQSKDTERYLSHYSPRFFSVSTDFNGWATYKRQVQKVAGNLSIALNNMSMLRYPDTQFQLAMVTFEQHYQTKEIHSIVQKRQYWINENQRWRILYEGPAQ